MSLEAAVADCKDGPFFTNWQVLFKEDTMDTAASCLDALVAPIQHLEDPRSGVISYAYSRTEQHRDDSQRKHVVYFTELFADLDSFQTHLTEAEAEPVVKLFECISGRVVGHVNSPLWHEGIKAAILSDQAQPTRTAVGYTLNPHPGTLLGGKYGQRILPERNKAVMLELRVHPHSKMASEQLLALLSPLTNITKTDFHTVCSYVVQGPGWWRRNPPVAKINLKTRDAKIPNECYSETFGSPDTLEFRMICSQPLGLRHKFQRSMLTELAAIVKLSVASEFIVTAENLQDEDLEDLLGYFEDNQLLTSDRRSLLSGFLLHPFYTKGWEDATTKTDGRAGGTTKTGGGDGGTTKTGGAFKLSLGNALARRMDTSLGNQQGEGGAGGSTGGDEPAFRIRRSVVKNQPEAVVLETRARKGPSSCDSFVVPLMDYLRTISRLGHGDKEVPIGTLFGAMERMRSMVREVAYINRLREMEDDAREEQGNTTRLQRIFTKLSLMGRGAYQKHFGSKLLCIDGLDMLIEALETEYAVIVDRAKKAVADNGSIEYLGLQEVYKIGSIVTTQSLSGVGGLMTSFKVTDCGFQPIRSLMGALRYSFSVTFETIVYMGSHFITVPFTEILGEWKNVKDISALPFLPVRGGATPSWIETRVKMLNSLCQSDTSYSYMEYPAGSFFPTLGGRKTKSSGASSSSVMRVAPGQVIVDVKTGLDLGYAPCSRTGNLGISLGMITKVYMDFLRKNTGAKVNLEEMNSANSDIFTAFDSFPTGMNAQPWPCVIGFSMNTKSWGYAVVDRLVPVLPDQRPWNELVLPPASKEMLMSLAKSKLQWPHRSRYSYDDVISGKGAGGLYLLYGPPGTGKTLTVEALARFFGKPLYSISFAELGSSTAELEEKLTVTLQLAGKWGCLALLDEGDALVEQRKQGQFLLNSMTGVLLRLLENFEGSLFINSNRVASFDPAALSRVTLAVKFTPLTEAGMQQVWRNTIARVLKSDTTRSLTYEEALAEVPGSFDLSQLATFPGSGRSVGAVMKMAIALCSHRDCDLTQTILDECVNSFLSFNTDLKSEGVQGSWDEKSTTLNA